MGLALGVAVLHEAPVAAGKLLSDDPAAEEVRLDAAIAGLRAQIDEMLDGHQGVLGPSYDLLETYKMLAYSRSWNHSLVEAVRDGVTAEVAVERVRNEHRASLGQARDPFLSERRARPGGPQRPAAAVHLAGDAGKARVLPDNAILIACNLGPADILEYDRDKLKGIFSGRGLAGQPRGHRRPRRSTSPASAACRTCATSSSQGDAVIVDAEMARPACGPAKTW